MRALLMTAKKKDYTSISFDFTDGTHTVSSLIDDGWSFLNSTATVDTTNGLYITHGSDRIMYALDLSNAGKIEIKSKVKYSHIPEAYQLGMIEVLAGGQYGNMVYGEMVMDGEHSTYTYSVNDGGGSSDTGSLSASSDGIYDTTFTIDIDNGTLTFKVEGYTELTTPLVSVSTVLNAYGVGYYLGTSNQYFTRSVMSMDIKIRTTTGWQPGANTVAYYPLKEDVLDYSGNGNNATGNPNSFTGGVANYSGASTTLPTSLVNSASTPVTMSVWLNAGTQVATVLGQHTNANRGFSLVYNHTNSSYRIVFNVDSGVGYATTYSVTYQDSSALSGWHHVVCMRDSSKIYLYLDGQYVTETSQPGVASNNTFYLGYDHGYGGGAWNGRISELIFEDKIRTAQEILDYYNATKDNYPQNRNSNNVEENYIKIEPTEDIHITPNENDNGSGDLQKF